MVAFVSRKLEFTNIPCFHNLWYFYILKRHIIPSHTCKKFFFVQFASTSICWLPSFELPFLPTAYCTNNSTPFRVTETCCTIINVKNYFSAIYLPLYLYRLTSFLTIFKINSFLKEILNIAETQRARCQWSWHNNNWVELGLKFSYISFKIWRQTYLHYAVYFK